MKIKKLGHCCLIIEEEGRKIMTDPGLWTVSESEKQENIDIIIITHEHSDHLHIDALKNILEKNKNAVIITNKSVGVLLDKENIKYKILENKKITQISGINIEAHSCKHEEIFREIGQVENTGFFITERLFYPGDSFYNPNKEVEILALPVAGPWTDIKSAINYALEIKPKYCFPVHDGMLVTFGSSHNIPKNIFEKENIIFKDFESSVKENF